MSSSGVYTKKIFISIRPPIKNLLPPRHYSPTPFSLEVLISHKFHKNLLRAITLSFKQKN